MAMTLDWQEALARVDGDEQLMQELIEVFFEEYPVLVDQMKQAIDQGDAAALQRAAHTLKGSVAVLGAQALAGAAEHVEQLAKAGDLNAVPKALDQLLREAELLIPELNKHLAQGRQSP